MILRAARPLDAGSLGAILSAVTDVTPWLPRLHSRAEDLSIAGRMVDAGWVTVAETSQIEGFVAQRGDEVLALFVAPGARGNGVGRRLLETAKAGRVRLTLWTFQANDRAQAFYAREGFREIERTDGTDNDEQLPDVHYVWESEALR